MSLSKGHITRPASLNGITRKPRMQILDCFTKQTLRTPEQIEGPVYTQYEEAMVYLYLCFTVMSVVGLRHSVACLSLLILIIIRISSFSFCFLFRLACFSSIHATRTLFSPFLFVHFLAFSLFGELLNTGTIY